MKKIIFFMIMVLIANFSFSQVGIGTVTPDTSTVLHVSNQGSKNKGVLLAPMTKSERDGIASPINGLLIYNTTENCLNYFNATKWRSMCGDNQLAQAEINLDGQIQLFGDYAEGRPTTDANYIIVPLSVTEEGSISLTVSTGNGYSFSYTNSLISTGKHLIKVPASGTPAAAGNDVGTISMNTVDTGSTVNITVAKVGGDKPFTVDCTSAIATNVFISGTMANGSGIKITLVNDSDLEVIYALSTDVVDGLSFSTTGVIVAKSTVTADLTANGTPTKAGVKKFTIKSNSTVETTNCSVDVTVAPKALTLFSNGYANYSYGYNSSWITGLTNQANFGALSSSKVKVGGINIIAKYHENATTLKQELEAAKPDIIAISYAISNIGAVNAMLQYAILNKVPVILNLENNEVSALNNYYPGVFGIQGGISGNFILNENVSNPDDILIYGPFSPAGVKTIAKDGGGDKWLNYTTLPTTIVPYMTNGSSIGMFRDDTKMLLYCPDGGVLNRTDSTDTKQYFSNAIAWAVDLIIKQGN